MREICLILAISFAVCTVIGAVFVIQSHGVENAGYAVVPMVLSILCFGLLKWKKEK